MIKLLYSPRVISKKGDSKKMNSPCVIINVRIMVNKNEKILHGVNDLLHRVNEDALCYELDLIGIAYQRQLELDVHYKNVVFDRKFRADLLVEKRILVENKAMKKITNQDEAQLINYFSRGIPMGKNNTIKIRVIV